MIYLVIKKTIIFLTLFFNIWIRKMHLIVLRHKTFIWITGIFWNKLLQQIRVITFYIWLKNCTFDVINFDDFTHVIVIFAVADDDDDDDDNVAAAVVDGVPFIGWPTHPRDRIRRTSPISPVTPGLLAATRSSLCESAIVSHWAT